MARLTAFVAEAAGLKPEAIGDYEHFIPWITAKDALCIEALHWYYLNYAAIIVKPATYDTLLWHLANAKIERHPFCTCMTMGQPMLEKVLKASSAAAFISTTGSPVGGEAVPTDGGSSAGYTEYRHGYNQSLINGWDPNGNVSWTEYSHEAAPLCDALITHLTDFGAIGIDLNTAAPVFICDEGIKKESKQQK